MGQSGQVHTCGLLKQWGNKEERQDVWIVQLDLLFLQCVGWSHYDIWTGILRRMDLFLDHHCFGPDRLPLLPLLRAPSAQPRRKRTSRDPVI